MKKVVSWSFNILTAITNLINGVLKVEMMRWCLEDELNQVSILLVIAFLLHYCKERYYFRKVHNFKENFSFETSENFRITNVQIQSIPFNHTRRKEIIFEIVMFYFEMRQLIIISCNIGSFGCWNSLE